MRKATATVLSLLLVLALTLSGCASNSTAPSIQSNSSPTTDVTTNAATDVTAQTTEGAFTFYKYEQPIKLTFHTSVGADAKFKEGQNIDNNDFIQWAKDEIGIEWSTKFVSPTNEDGATKINLLMASGDLPDAIFAETPQMGVLENAGMLANLNDLIDKYGSPLLKDRINAAQEASGGNFFSSYTSNGNIYAMPTDADLWGRTYYNTFIRQDILTELGKEVPQTLEQFEDVLAAYKAKYPAGVGVFLDKDLVPGGVNQMSPAMQPFGAYPGRWVTTADGKLAYGSIQPQTKQGLETLAKWYKNGWLDKEFIVKDFTKATEALTAGNMLSITGDWWYPYYPFPDVAKNTPTATFAATSLKGPDGAVKLIGGNPFDYAIAISASCKHPEAFIYQLNDMMDSMLRNEVDIRDKMKKEYNYDFKYPVESDSALVATNPEAPQELQNFVYQKYGPGYFQSILATKYFPGFEFSGLVDDSYNTSLLVGDALKKNDSSTLKVDEKGVFDNFTNLKVTSAVTAETTLARSIRSALSFDGYLGAPTPTMIEKNAYLLKLENEEFAKIIMGAGTPDEFEKFVADWKKAGGDKITEEVNDWYAKLK